MAASRHWFLFSPRGNLFTLPRLFIHRKLSGFTVVGNLKEGDHCKSSLFKEAMLHYVSDLFMKLKGVFASTEFQK